MDVFLFVAFLAGILTVLAPCILPLLPVVIGASEPGTRGISLRAFTVIGALSLSVIAFTFLLKASTLLIVIPQMWWVWFSGAVITLVGIAMVFPEVWARVPIVSQMSRASNKALGAGYQKKSVTGDAIIGLALGPVFTTCSPTYLFIIATVLPATFATGALYLFSFTLGLALSLLALAYFGQQLVSMFVGRERQTETAKKIFGVLIVLVGLAIFTEYDKKVETWILDSGYGATINFEERLIEQFAPSLQ
jgi:cytochrome c biogenesis protein CcdA